MVRPDGSHYDTLISAAPLKNAEGEISGAVAGLLDITERKRAEAERDRLRAREIETRSQKDERRRIARDLHDLVLQDLSGTLQSLRLTQLRSQDSGIGLDLAEELEAIRRAIAGLRGAIHDLRHEKERPFVEVVESLVELNRQAVPERGTELVIKEGFPRELPGEVGVELARVLQEALTNIRRHSGARNVVVELRMEGEEILARVIDNGRGFDLASAQASVGLSAMRERVEAVGGKIETSSRPGEGTGVTVRIRLEGDTPTPRRL